MKNEVKNVGKNKSSTVIKYQKDHYNTLSIRYKKEDSVLLLLDYASKTLGITKGDYVRDALMGQFERDGITIDMLPEFGKYIPQPEPKQPKQHMIYLVTSLYIPEERYKAEEYVSIFQTLKNARAYATKKLSNKAYPDDWRFAIYGKNIEAMTKMEAEKLFRDMVEKARYGFIPDDIEDAEWIDDDDDELIDDGENEDDDFEDEEDFDSPYSFVEYLKEHGGLDYMETVTLEGGSTNVE